MTTLDEQITWIKTHIDNELAAWEGATKGPWTLEGFKDCVRTPEALFCTEHITDASCIARSRTIGPAALRALKSLKMRLELMTPRPWNSMGQTH